jgi:PPM family protein phosphatase
MSFMTALISRAGGRNHNEDFCSFTDVCGSGCWVIADGLGGHRGGEIASRSAVDAVLSSFGKSPQLDPQTLQGHLKAAQSAVLNAQTVEPGLSTMRTTIVILIADATGALWAHMGDSRLYFFENGAIASQTRDHSVVQMMVDAGELAPAQIRHHEDRNRVLRCLGNPEADFRPAVHSEQTILHKGSAFLLCTDGFWENVLESEMTVDLAKAAGPTEWLNLMEDRILERLSEGDDNYTGLAVIVNSDSAPASPGRVASKSEKPIANPNRFSHE